MSARRLWYSIASLAAFLGFFAAAHADDDAGKPAPVRVEEARPLTDFLILAVKPDADEGNDTVEIGRTKIEEKPLGTVVKSLPFDFFGLRKQKYDEAAELARCWAACRAQAQCRDVVYERATAARPVGVCRLKTYAAVERHFTPMAPVVEPGDVRAERLRAKREAAARATVEPARNNVQPSATLAAPQPTRPPPKRPERPRDEAVPPPPRVAPAIAQYFPLPPRKPAEPATPLLENAPPRDPFPPRLPPITVERFPLPARVVVEAPPALAEIPTPPVVEIAPPPFAEEPPVVEPETPPPAVASGPPKSILTPQAPPQIAETTNPAERKRGMPLWIALGAVALMLGGATLYWRNHRVRTLGRLSTRLISDGLEGQVISIVGAEHRGLDLRFAVSASAAVNAPGTHIELIAKGEAA